MEQTSLEIARVDDRVRPANEQEGLRRALFLCHGLNAHCAKQVRVFLKRCRDGEFGLEVEESASGEVPDWQIAEATKELLTMSLHLTGLDQGASEAPIWLLEFLIDGLKESNMLFPEPSAETIIAAYGNIAEEDLVGALSGKLCATLGIPSEETALASWRESLETNKSYRNELLFFALTQPPDTLRQHLQLIG